MRVTGRRQEFMTGVKVSWLLCSTTNNDQKSNGIYLFFDEADLATKHEIERHAVMQRWCDDVVQIWDNGEMLREEIDADFDGRRCSIRT